MIRPSLLARACVGALGAQLRMLKAQILQFDRMIMAWHRGNETSKRLDALPGVGPALATALVASVADPRAFRSGQDFSAWIGLVPKQCSSGGKQKLGSISKRGDRYLRDLFTAGALAVIRHTRARHLGQSLVINIGNDMKQFLHAMTSDRCDNVKLGKMGADRIDHRR